MLCRIMCLYIRLPKKLCESLEIKSKTQKKQKNKIFFQTFTISSVFIQCVPHIELEISMTNFTHQGSIDIFGSVNVVVYLNVVDWLINYLMDPVLRDLVVVFGVFLLSFVVLGVTWMWFCSVVGSSANNVDSV